MKSIDKILSEIPREFRSLRFLRGRPEQLISPGVHIGRRHDSPPGTGWEVVFVDIVEDRDTAFTFVFRFGQSEPEPWRDWELQLYLVGMETLTREALNMPVIEEASLALH